MKKALAILGIILAMSLMACTSTVEYSNADVPGVIITMTGTTMPNSMMPAQLGGEITTGNTVIPVGGPFTFPDADATALQNKLLSLPPDTNVTVFGYSKGAVAATKWIKRYGPTSQLNPRFVFIGDSFRRYGGQASSGTVPADTRFTVIDIARQYDQYADNPTVTSSPSFLQVSSWIKTNGIHQNYRTVSMYDPSNLVYQQGNITYVLIPTTLSDPGTQALYEQAYNRPEISTAAAQNIVLPVFHP
jgi:hypothetical protein